MGQGGSGADDTGRSTGDTFERYVAQPFEENILKAKQDFHDPKQEWRRLFSELWARSSSCWSPQAAG